MSDKTPLPPISSELALAPIRRFMSTKVISLQPSTTVRVAMETMLNHRISGLVVVDSTDSVLGVYSELDAMLQGAAETLDRPIHYTKPAKSLLADTAFRDVLILIAKNKVKRFPIVDSHNKLMGIVTRRDLMKAIFKDISNVRK